jgi:transcriptional regulator with GAF, ATPase, and Fis domain
VAQVARSDAPVLLLGETGSGKEVVARSIYRGSDRSAAPFVRVNCGAIPVDLIDSELFGHERGSFTGAVAQRKGWFERADDGTLFMDEVAELPLAAQVRLLRVLQDGLVLSTGGCGANDRSRRTDHRGDQPERANDDARRTVSRGSLVSTRGIPDRSTSTS